MMLASSNSSSSKGRTAVVLIVIVMLLFAIWLGLKATWNTSESRKSTSDVDQKQSTSKRETDALGSDQEKGDTGEKDADNIRVEEVETNTKDEVIQKEKDSGSGTETDTQSSSSSNETDQNVSKKDSSSKDESVTSQTNSNSSGQDDEEQEIQNSDSKQDKEDEEAGDEQENVTDKDQKESSNTDRNEHNGELKEKADKEEAVVQKGETTENRTQRMVKTLTEIEAEKFFDEKKYFSAMKLLDRAIDSTFFTLESRLLQWKLDAWKTTFDENKELAQIWIDKAEDAAKEANWETVITNAQKALNYLPGNSKASALIKKARKKKKYQNMVKIPAGTYSISTDDETGATKLVAPFYIDRNEVTNEEYKEFIKETDHEAPLGWKGREIPPGKSDHPVTGIQLSDASAYASWAGKRLPAAFEWEAAARGKEGRKYPWGNSKTVQNGGIPANTAESGNNGTVSVDEYQNGCTPDNVCHMLGNVAEWTRTSVKNSEGEERHIVKGGSFLYPVENGLPGKQLLRDPQARLIGIGFRCVKDSE